MTLLADPPSTPEAVLSALTGQVPLLGAACRRHREEKAIETAARAWAAGHGLAASGLTAARFGDLASRAFPETRRERVELFAQWLIWLFAFDDLRDDTALGRDPRALDRFYGSLLARMHRAAEEAEPLSAALCDLWARSVALASPGWCARFQRHLAEHRAACVREAENRARGRVPTIVEYADLRRAANGMFMFDLAEPVNGVRLPDALVRTAAWRTLVSACNDVTAWCNDIASLAKERALGDVHNYVVVISRTGGVEPVAAAAIVAEQVAFRVAQMQAAARSLPAEYARLALTEAQARDASRVAVTYLGAPRGHLEWILDSPRYHRDGRR